MSYQVIVKNPSDFIGAHLGGSEEKTKAILASTVGKVLVIDEVSVYLCYRPVGAHHDFVGLHARLWEDQRSLQDCSHRYNRR